MHTNKQTAFPHVVSEAPGMCRVGSVRETSGPSSTRAWVFTLSGVARRSTRWIGPHPLSARHGAVQEGHRLGWTEARPGKAQECVIGRAREYGWRQAQGRDRRQGVQPKIRAGTRPAAGAGAHPDAGAEVRSGTRLGGRKARPRAGAQARKEAGQRHNQRRSQGRRQRRGVAAQMRGGQRVMVRAVAGRRSAKEATGAGEHAGARQPEVGRMRGRRRTAGSEA